MAFIEPITIDQPDQSDQKETQLLHQTPTDTPRSVAVAARPFDAIEEEEQDIVPPLTPSPIQLPDRKMNKDGKLQRKLNWSVEEKVKMLTTVCLKMERTSEGYNVDGMKHLKYVFKLISPKAETDPEHSRLWGDFIAYYWRTGHPADSSQSGGGMHTFLKEQCDAIGQKFTQATLRRNLKKFVEEYQRQLNSKQRAKRKKPDK